MNVGPGTRLGPYELIAVLGAGGMGEVYRARDLNLGREVAVKIVRARFSQDQGHLDRFRREAHVLASLTHPHIASIYGLDETSGVLFLAMELVPGETLEERLVADAPSLNDTLRIAQQVAAGLEAAHDKGIIHRDLKPANIKITPDGVVKILDFGLAKILDDSASASLFSQSATEATSRGTILGTVGYMSPEQARGRALDRRTDIWSFGCVLFRMITRQRPFLGETVSDTIVSILEREPDWRLVPETTPAAVRRLLERCLQKDLQRRLRDIGDARIEVEEALSASATRVESGTPETVTAPFRRPWWRTAGAVGLIAIAALVGYLYGAGRSAPAHRPIRQFVSTLPPAERFAGLDFPAVALSPDGSQIVYVATRGGRAQLFLRSLDRLEAAPVPGTSDAISPFFSPDGRWIGFFADGKLKKVPTTGGAPITICDAAIGFGGAWGPRDRIVFSPTTGSGLMEVSARGGDKPTRATTLDAANGEFSHRWPELLPDGETVLFTVGTLGSWDDAQIVAESLSSRRRTVLVQGGTHPHYLKTGHLVYARGGSLFAVRFDPRSMKVSGQPARVLDNVMQSSDGAAQAAIAGSGDAVYVPASLASADRRLVEVDRSGASMPLAAPPRAYTAPRLAPDGHRVIVSISGANEDLWVYDIAAGSLQQLTFDANATSPVWGPDSGHVTFSWNKDGPPNLFWIRVGESSREERLATSEFPQVAGSWSPDGRTLAYVESRPSTGRDIWVLSKEGDRTPVSLIATTFDETAPQFSGDGRTIVFVSNESGRNEVYVTRADDPAHAIELVSRDGGTEPVWSRATRELIFRSGNRLLAVSQPAGGSWSGAKPRILFERPFEKGTIDVADYDVAPDGQHFIMVQAGERDTAPQELHIVLSWADSLATAPQ